MTTIDMPEGGSIRTVALTKSYSSTPALWQCNLDVRAGEIVGLLGPNGAGKSTAMRIIAGLMKPDGGQALICNHDIHADPLHAKAVLGYVPESPRVYEHLSPLMVMEIVAGLHGLSVAIARARCDELFESLELREHENVPLSQCSKGTRQKVVIAAALVHNPKALVLDEPFDGIDTKAIVYVKSKLKELSAAGCAILLSSHVIELVQAVCSRLVVLVRGATVAEGTIDGIIAAHGRVSLEESYSRLTR